MTRSLQESLQQLPNRPLLMAKYRIQRTALIRNTTVLNRQAVQETLELALLLDTLHVYLNEPREVNELRRDQRRLRYALGEQLPEATLVDTQNTTHTLRGHIETINWFRLVLIRLRRLINATILLESCAIISPYIRAAEPVVAPLFLYSGWIFFIPRLGTNLLMLAKHTFPNPWMPDEEREVPWFRRFCAQMNMERRGFEIVSDLAWFTSGLVACFVCVGPLNVLRAYIAIGLQIFDLLLTTVRACIELNRIRLLHNTMDDVFYQPALKEHLWHELRFHGLAVMNNVILLIAILTLLPAVVAFNPLLPVLGGVLALVASVLIYIGRPAVRARRPADDFSQCRFFKPTAIPAPAPAPDPTPITSLQDERDDHSTAPLPFAS
jgi:hypothetical protein